MYKDIRQNSETMISGENQMRSDELSLEIESEEF
jgi:hypothetical protein